MYALHLAINSIRSGDCDSAIVASSNWIGDPGVQMALDKMGALSATSRCHTFDAKADGYARGEGYAALYLKRSSLAITDGSPIRALVRGSSVNANGRSIGISRPSVAGQEAVIREAYRNAGNLPYDDTAYFECHGTGTSVGDPIEVTAVGSVFAAGRSETDPLLVGSVKTNLGHSEGASALASVMKVVLSLEKGKIPPVYSMETPNPDIDFAGTKVKVVDCMTDWPENKLLRASINSFGYGGSNGHCIIDHVHTVFENYVKPGVYRANGLKNGTRTSGKSNGSTVSAASENAQDNIFHNGGHNLAIQHSARRDSQELTMVEDAPNRRLILLPFSAHTETSLQMNIQALARSIPRAPLADIAYTLGAKRSKLAYRAFRIVQEDDMVRSLAEDGKPTRAPTQSARLGFVFTGQVGRFRRCHLIAQYFLPSQ
jgi:acyl transferase domain-containing protein